MTEQEWLKKAAAASFAKINSSTYFLSLYSKDYGQDPGCVLQIGYAIITGKPIYLLVERGEEISPGLRRIASGIEYWDRGNPKSVEDATLRIIQNAGCLP